jgi:hypothetical protein
MSASDKMPFWVTNSKAEATSPVCSSSKGASATSAVVEAVLCRASQGGGQARSASLALQACNLIPDQGQKCEPITMLIEVLHVWVRLREALLKGATKDNCARLAPIISDIHW